MKGWLTTLVAVAAILISVGLMIAVTYNVATIKQDNARLAKQLDITTALVAELRSEKTSVATTTIPKDGEPGEDGKTPPCYYEKSQCRGENAISEKTVETIIKEYSKESPYKDINWNHETGNLEVKLSTDTFWEVLIPCSAFVVGCPETLKLESIPEIGEL